MAPAATGEFSSKDGPPALGLVALGLFVLAVGSLVYLSDRDSARALWIPAVPALAGHPLFGAAGAWLPSLAHAFAFSLFTATALPLRLAWRYGACGAWFAIHAAFEWGQHPSISPALAANIERHLGSLPGSRSLAGYFVRGVFDRGDIAAAATGALAAAVVLRLAHRSSETLHAG